MNEIINTVEGKKQQARRGGCVFRCNNEHPVAISLPLSLRYQVLIRLAK